MWIFLYSRIANTIIIFFFIAVPIKYCFGQNWEYREYGNNFDGYKRYAEVDMSVNEYRYRNPSPSFFNIQTA